MYCQLQLENNLDVLSLQDSFGNVRSLRLLYLQNNCLTALPPSLGHLALLEVLNASFNRIEALPDTMAGGMESLQVLQAGVNALAL